MKDELQSKLLEYISNLDTFARSELPQVAQQIIDYGIYQAQVSIVVGVILTIVSIVLISKIKKHNKLGNDGICMILAIVVCITSLFSIPSILCGVTTLRKIQIAPKVYLLDYVRGNN